MSGLGIVVIGYNRGKSLHRLLQSLERAIYTEEVLLIISLDKSGDNEIEIIANKFVWTHGEKKVLVAKEKMGLRKHIIYCGDYIEKYNLRAISVFEDDIWVSPYFFEYYKQTVDKYENNNNIAGISLYTREWNQTVNRPFEPLKTEYDIYFQQLAQSWGQIWCRRQWKEFRQWYEENKEWPPKTEKDIPQNILEWSENSWLKYHIAYCIIQNKYFVYPYLSLTTNFSDIGEHMEKQDAGYQVQTLGYNKTNYSLCNMDQKGVAVYDAFFENENLKQYFNDLDGEVLIDLYGMKRKTNGERFILTSKDIKSKVIRSYGLMMRPQEKNIIQNIEGDHFRLYDLEKNNFKFERNGFNEEEYLYDIRHSRRPLKFDMKFLLSRSMKAIFKRK